MASDAAAERERILAAAYRCLALRGGSSVSVTEILAAAGLSTRAFYRHFDSKDSLLLAMFRRDTERVLAELRTAAAQAPSPPDALRHWIDGLLRLTSEAGRRRHVMILTSEEAQRATGYGRERSRFIAAQEAAMAQILSRGRDDGSFPWADPGPDARAILAVLSSAFEDLMSRETPVETDEAADRVANFAFRALGAATGAWSGPAESPRESSAAPRA